MSTYSLEQLAIDCAQGLTDDALARQIAQFTDRVAETECTLEVLDTAGVDAMAADELEHLVAAGQAYIENLERSIEVLDVLSELTLPQRRGMYALMRDMVQMQRQTPFAARGVQ